MSSDMPQYWWVILGSKFTCAEHLKHQVGKIQIPWFKSWNQCARGFSDEDGAFYFSLTGVHSIVEHGNSGIHLAGTWPETERAQDEHKQKTPFNEERTCNSRHKTHPPKKKVEKKKKLWHIILYKRIRTVKTTVQRTIVHSLCLKKSTQCLLGALWHILKDAEWELIEVYTITQS